MGAESSQYNRYYVQNIYQAGHTGSLCGTATANLCRAGSDVRAGAMVLSIYPLQPITCSVMLCPVVLGVYSVQSTLSTCIWGTRMKEFKIPVCYMTRLVVSSFY